MLTIKKVFQIVEILDIFSIFKFKQDLFYKFLPRNSGMQKNKQKNREERKKLIKSA